MRHWHISVFLFFLFSCLFGLISIQQFVFQMDQVDLSLPAAWASFYNGRNGAFQAQCKYEVGNACMQNYTKMSKNKRWIQGIRRKYPSLNPLLSGKPWCVKIIKKKKTKNIQLDQFVPFNQMPSKIIPPFFPLLPPMLQSPVDITLFTVCWHGKYFRVK